MHEAAFPALTSVVIVSVISFVGAVVLALGPARIRGVVPFLVAVSAGALLGDAFLHLLPEATEHHGGFGGTVAWCTLGGVLFFFLVESVIHWHHHGDDMEAHEHGHVSSLAWMNLLGDGMHNLVDGILIGGTWMVSPEAGIATTVAVALHEIPQEFGDFGVLLHAGLPVKKALLLNAASASLAIFGALLVLSLGSDLGLEPYLGPIAAGGFLYVACADLVPELHKRARGMQLLGTIAALALGLFVVNTLPALLGHGHSHSHGGHAHGAHGDAHEHGPDHDHDEAEDDGHEHEGDEHEHEHEDGEEGHEHEHEHDGDDAHEHEHEHDEDGHEHDEADEPEHEEDGHDHEDDDDPEDGNHDEHDE